MGKVMSIQGAKEGAMGRYKTCLMCDEHIDYYGGSLCDECQAVRDSYIDQLWTDVMTKEEADDGSTI